jgi:hypothetical protein
MIISCGTDRTNGNEVIMLLLTDQNVLSLIEGRPIEVKRETHGDGIPMNLTIVLAHRKDERAIVETLVAGGAINKNTPIFAQPGRKAA